MTRKFILLISIYLTSIHGLMAHNSHIPHSHSSLLDYLPLAIGIFALILFIVKPSRIISVFSHDKKME